MRKGEAALDAWSLVHVASGLALGFVVQSWLVAFLLLAVYELFEGALRRVRLKDGGLFEYESWVNVVADVIVGMAGWLAIRVAFTLGWLPAAWDVHLLG